MAGDDFFTPDSPARSATIFVDVNGPVSEPTITYRRDDAGPFATEVLDEDGSLSSVAMNSGSVQWRRLDQADLPMLMGAQWAWGLNKDKSWDVEARVHPFRAGTADLMAMRVTWDQQDCAGVLTVGPGTIDGEAATGYGGWRTTFDENSLPLRFEQASADGEWFVTLERVAFTAGSGLALPASEPGRTEPLAVVPLQEVHAQRPGGFVLTLDEAIAAIEAHPVGAAYLAQYQGAQLRSFVHTPLPGGEWWGIDMYDADGERLLDSSVRAYTDGRPTLVDAKTASLSGDVAIIQGDVVSLEAIAAWHAGVSNATMDSIWCEPGVLFGMCVFGSAQEVAANFSDGAGPGVVDGAGFGQGYRVNQMTGIITDVKLG